MLRELLDKQHQEYTSVIAGYKARIASLESYLTVMSQEHAKNFLEEKLNEDAGPLFVTSVEHHEVPLYDIVPFYDEGSI